MLINSYKNLYLDDFNCISNKRDERKVRDIQLIKDERLICKPVDIAGQIRCQWRIESLVELVFIKFPNLMNILLLSYFLSESDLE